MDALCSMERQVSMTLVFPSYATEAIQSDFYVQVVC